MLRCSKEGPNMQVMFLCVNVLFLIPQDREVSLHFTGYQRRYRAFFERHRRKLLGRPEISFCFCSSESFKFLLYTVFLSLEIP